MAAVQKGGVVGLGGAAFPTHVKLLPPKDIPIEVLLVNGAECEPFLTTDHRTMVEFPDRVWFGVRIMMKALGVGRAVIGIEKNKPDAIEALEKTKPGDLNAEVQGLYVKYPQGAEKMLIKAVTGREVPSGKLPMHVGAVVQNVGTIACIAEIFETGLPLVERVVTVTGPGVRKPGNLIVPVGAKFRDILAFCGGITENVTEILSGGPMMGSAQPDLDAPATKGVTGIVVLTDKESRPRTVYPCISCGHCLDACPMFLNPSLMGKLAQTARYPEMTEKANLWDCMLCGACSYVCPSNIPLSQMFGMAKYQLGRLRRKEECGMTDRDMSLSPEERLLLTASPHLKSPDSTPKIMWNVVGSLVPIILVAIYYFGPSAILVMAASIIGAMSVEYFFGPKTSLWDGSAAITGILLGLCLPAGFPLWMAFLGGSFRHRIREARFWWSRAEPLQSGVGRAGVSTSCFPHGHHDLALG